MKDVVALAKKQVVQLEKEIVEQEKEIAEKKKILEKLHELLVVAGAKAPQKRGPKPKGAKRGPKPKGAKRGPKPKGAKRGPKPKGAKRGPKPKADSAPKKRGRKAAAAGTLPAMIIDVLAKAGKPLNAKEITARLEKKGWTTKSGDPQAMVYKTLHRIERSGVVAKASRGLFTVN
ncbi:MAG: HTH domain-containing protein [Candidatus Lernaella stagnicola]|nr:HTH domain-containing protein [Candidatus Lernaella stagnicola]